MNPSEQDVRASVIDFLVGTALVPAADLDSGAARLGDLNIDSLSAVEMLWTVEQKYGVRLPNPQGGLASMTIDELAARFAEAAAGAEAASAP